MRPFGARIACCILLLSAASRAASAQTQPSASSADSLEVFLVSMGPGNEVWEKFGHNALIVVDRATGIQAAYNYGIFDFNQPYFIGRFILGRMRYEMDAFDAQPMIDSYITDDRDVILQELSLTAAQKIHLRDFLEWNRQPQNREYLYEYYRANCSTKLRDALDRTDVLDGQIQRQLEKIQTGKTFRWYTRIGMADDRTIYTGLELALGRPTDKPISAWEECFMPMKLAEHLRSVKVKDEEGNLLPLVRNERMLHRSSVARLPASPPTWWPWYLLIGIVYACALYFSARRGLTPSPGTPGEGRGEGSSATAHKPKSRKNPHPNPLPEYRARGKEKWPRIAFGVLSVLWSLVAGLSGCFLIFALTTDHAAAKANHNLLLLSPLCIFLVAFAPSVVRKRRFAKAARVTSLIVLASAILAVLFNLFHSVGQWNWDLIALALPVHAALAAALWTLTNPKKVTEL